MPPRYAYWTIIAGGLPTAFRAAEREELLPTFQRIKDKHPDAQMKYFARGKLWESPEAMRAAERRGDRGHRRPDEARHNREPRTRDWRPGGDHRDPRQKFTDAKKERNAEVRKQRWERKNAPPRERPHGDPLRDDLGRRPEGFRKPRPAVSGGQGDRPQGKWSRPKDRPPRDRKPQTRGQGTEEPRQPRPRGPNREPKPNETPEPTPPPRPDQPVTPPPGPPERGRTNPRRPYAPRGRFPKGPRR